MREDAIVGALAALKAQVKELGERLERPPRQALTVEHAASALDLSASTMKRMIRRKTIETVEIDGVRGKRVPQSEIDRLSRLAIPAPRPGRPRRPKASPKSTAKERAAAIDRLARSKD